MILDRIKIKIIQTDLVWIYKNDVDTFLNEKGKIIK